jgi:parallel beta-helix repeat protein
VGARGNAINVTKNYITLDGLEVQGANVSWMGNVHMESDGVHHFTMQNCESKWGANGFAIGPGNGGSNTVKDCIIHHNIVHGMSSDTDTGPTSSSQNYIQRNTIYSNGSNGIVIDGNYWVVENNVVYDNGTNTSEDIGIHVYTSGPSSGSGSSNIIRFNIVYNQKGAANDGAGIAIDQWCDNNQVYYNICYDNDGPGFYNYDATGNVFYNNVAYGNCRNSSGGLTMKSEFRLTGARTSNTTLKNNIGYATAPNTYAIYLNSDTYDSTLTITNNVWFSLSADWYYFNVTPGADIRDWNGFTSSGADLYADPEFVSPGTNFHLTATSPCIDAGVPVGLVSDFQGSSISGVVDIGAYEYSRKLQPPFGLRVAVEAKN